MSSVSRFLQVDSWEDAQLQSLGYEHPSVINFYKNLPKESFNSKTPILKQRIDVFRDCWNKLSHLSNPTVLDIGGGNGYFSSLIKQPFASWTVLESPGISAIYNCKYKDTDIKFVSEIPNMYKSDICIMSCVLHYVQDPEELIRNILKISKAVIILRHCETKKEKDTYAVQKISTNSVELSWPIRFFRKGWLAEQLGSQYKIIKKYKMLEYNKLNNSKIYLSSSVIIGTTGLPHTSTAINN